MQRFKRLERELNELKRDLNEIENVSANKENQEQSSNDFDPIELTKQLENLRKQINVSHLQSIGVRTDLDSKSKK